MNTILRKSALSVAGLMVTGGAVAGPAIATPAVAGPADGAPPAPPTPAESAPAPAAPPQPPPPGDEGKRVLPHDYQRQPNEYYCAPAATRIALSTQGKVVSQREVAEKLGTTTDGTDSVDDTTRVLNELTGGGYETTKIEGVTAEPEQVDRLRTDVIEAVDAKRGIVANTMGTAVDTSGEKHSFPGGHYMTIVGYRDGGEVLKIADPYDPTKHYWMSDDKAADWIAQKGYSS
ncbi:C39 family peptidase [Micromonospora sp. NPDC049799]|uniref:C39 family peptidase n=1 Tax=Micromonospora sp. NPDC049799 TaxID=3154741 RepID=UPI0033DAB12B